MTWGVECLLVPTFVDKNYIDYTIVYAKSKKLCKPGEKIIVIKGSDENNPDTGDILEIKTVLDKY